MHPHLAPWPASPRTADFWLTRVLARVAVPFFLMVSGYFLAQRPVEVHRALSGKDLLPLSARPWLLYLPLNWYNGGYSPSASG